MKRAQSGRATIFGVRDIAVIMRTGGDGKASEDYGIRIPTLVKLLRKLGDEVRIRHTSQFDGMTDGRESVPEAHQGVSVEAFCLYLDGDRGVGREFSRNTGGIYFSASDQSIHVFDACGSYRVEWKAEIERRAAVLAATPLPKVDQIALAAVGLHLHDVERNRDSTLDKADPMAFDEHHAALTARGMSDPMLIIAYCNPAWLAQLQERATTLADRICDLAEATVAA